MAAHAAALQKRLGRKVRQLRQDRRWSQEVLGVRAGLSYKFVGEIERGGANPTLSTLAGLAAAFDIAVTALFADDPTPSRDYPLSREEFIAVQEAKESLAGIVQRFGDMTPSTRPFPKGRRRLPK
jgi:transcriptional regulator with XRE-family HTH domain